MARPLALIVACALVVALASGAAAATKRGTARPDRITGTPDADRLFGRAIRDAVDCGPGYDRVSKDRRDRTRNCEVVE